MELSDTTLHRSKPVGYFLTGPKPLRMSVNPQAKYTRVAGGNIMMPTAPPARTAMPRRLRSNLPTHAQSHTTRQLYLDRTWRSRRRRDDDRWRIQQRCHRRGFARQRDRPVRRDFDHGEPRHRRLQHLLAPCIDQPRADPVPVGHHRATEPGANVSRTIDSLSFELQRRRRSDRSRTSTCSGRAFLQPSYDPSYEHSLPSISYRLANHDTQAGQISAAPQFGGSFRLLCSKLLKRTTHLLGGPQAAALLWARVKEGLNKPTPGLSSELS